METLGEEVVFTAPDNAPPDVARGFIDYKKAVDPKLKAAVSAGGLALRSAPRCGDTRQVWKLPPTTRTRQCVPSPSRAFRSSRGSTTSGRTRRSRWAAWPRAPSHPCGAASAAGAAAAAGAWSPRRARSWMTTKAAWVRYLGRVAALGAHGRQLRGTASRTARLSLLRTNHFHATPSPLSRCSCGGGHLA
jgi:hypothetical protein